MWHTPALSHQAPSIVWPSNSSSAIFNTPKSSKPPLRQSAYNESLWQNVVGTNVFFPTSPTAGISGVTMNSGVKRLSGESPKKAHEDHFYRQKVQNRKKYGGVKVSGAEKSISSSMDNGDLDNEAYNNCKDRLSLNALRNTLCRQKGVENLNNDEMARLSGVTSGDDFLQVYFYLLLYYFNF